MFRFLWHSVVFVALTAMSQLGGIAWLTGLMFRRRIIAFVVAYCVLSLAAIRVAPIFGRVPLPCVSGSPVQMQSGMYCALNRRYVVPELREVLFDLGAAMAARYPGTTTLVLDANFPFFAGFPLLPHLSHDDGRKVDLAFYYRDESGYLPEATKSPIGYFAFEQGKTDCPKRLASLRWDMVWLQDFWPDYRLDRPRMTAALQWLAAERRVGKILLEPHLRESLGVQSTKVRFQGCRAARHDDHIHLQL